MRFSLIGIGLALLVSACATQPLQTASFSPGLGEIMAQTAQRHAKLWLAGQAGNWPLAAYEMDELEEGFEDAEKYHPSHKSITRPMAELIAQYMDPSMQELAQAIETKNAQAFVQRYEQLTAACNACHQASGFGFNRVVKPTFNPFANQAFESTN